MYNAGVNNNYSWNHHY